ncbi:MAG: argininosuccinate lyase [Saprospiraceae bacterium]
MKLWQKGSGLSAAVERFTAGQDREMDLQLAAYDVLGSLAHLAMLEKVQLVGAEEARALRAALLDIHAEVKAGAFVLEPGIEDVHSQVELLLTRRVGEAGKKIHTGRSRNDQVLTDLKLFFRAEIETLTRSIQALFDLLLQKSETHQADLMPGYTHFQVAMPSSFGLWFAAYAESLSEDLWSLQAAYRLANKNPLGSAAGYGSSFPLDRDLTTELLGFDAPHVNAIAAQMSRGKTERAVAQALGNVAATLGKLSADCCLFMSQNFGFITFPDELTTGSSIMPHKKNPDVFEIVRARCNSLQALPNEIALIISNLPSGYHRDFQVLKEKLFPAFGMLRDCLEMLGLMLENMEVHKDILADERYKYVFTVEEVNRLVQSGLPFREAYRQVGASVEAGTFQAGEMLPHAHLGSIGNLGNHRIQAAMVEVLASFGFERFQQAEEKLLTR